MGALYVYYPYYIIPAFVTLFFLLARKIPMSRLTWKISLGCSGIALIIGLVYGSILLYQNRSEPVLPQLVFHLPSNILLYTFAAFWLGFIPALLFSLFKKNSIPNPRVMPKPLRIIAWALTLFIIATSLLLGYGENLRHILQNDYTDAQTLRALSRNAIVRRDAFHAQLLAGHKNTPDDVREAILTDESIHLNARIMALQTIKTVSCQGLFRMLSVPRENIVELNGVSAATQETIPPETLKISLFMHRAMQLFTDKRCAAENYEELKEKP